MPLEVILYLLQTGQLRSSYMSGGIINCVLERGDWVSRYGMLHFVRINLTIGHIRL